MDDYEHEDALRSFLGTTSFGKQSKVLDTTAQIEKSRRNVTIEPKRQALPESSGSDNSDDSDDSDDSDEEEFPVSHELVIKTHDKAVTSITVDPSGTRMMTGSQDCMIKLHDFTNMTPTTIRAFKTIDPGENKVTDKIESHPVQQVMFNPNAPSLVLVVTALPQAKVLDRDGEQYKSFVKGDMYLRDMHNTKGHISELTGGAWHPWNRDMCVTSGTDGTLRIWDINNPRQQKHIIVQKSRDAGSGGKTRMTAVAWGPSPNGSDAALVGAAHDGTLSLWLGEGPYNRPSAEIRDAHRPGTWTSGLAVSGDGRLVASRGGDDTIKLWDIRNFKESISTASHESTSMQFPSSNLCFSPSSANIITGSAAGNLHILNTATLRPELVTPVTPGSAVVTVYWHEKLNQIITGSANAETHVLYSPNLSTGGAKMVMLKAPKRRHVDENLALTTDMRQGLSGDAVHTPDAPDANALRGKGKGKDPRRPFKPAATPFAKSQPDEQHIRDHIPLSGMRDEDPREALLKYADKADKDKIFTKAWATTQPKTIYAELSSDEDEDERDKKKPRR